MLVDYEVVLQGCCCIGDSKCGWACQCTSDLIWCDTEHCGTFLFDYGVGYHSADAEETVRVLVGVSVGVMGNVTRLRTVVIFIA